MLSERGWSGSRLAARLYRAVRAPSCPFDRPWTRFLQLSAAAVLVVSGTVVLGRATTSEERSWRVAADLAKTGRALRKRLNDARREAQRLGVPGAPLANDEPLSRVALHDFVSSHPWSRSVLLASVAEPPLLVQREPSRVECGLGHAEETARLSAGNGYLGPGVGTNPVRLCLGVALMRKQRRTVVVVEVDAAALFGDLEGPGGERAMPRVTDRHERTVVGSLNARPSPNAVDLVLDLPGWQGPATGPWRLTASEESDAAPATTWSTTLGVINWAFGLTFAVVASPRSRPGRRGSSSGLKRAIERHVFGNNHRSGDLPEAAPSADPFCVDPQILERLKTLESNGAPGFLADLARDFDHSFTERFEELRFASETGDAALMESASHCLKGSAAVLGAQTLSQQCGRLERLARQGAVADGSDLDCLADEHGSVMSVLEATVASLSTRPPDIALSWTSASQARVVT